MSEHALQGDDDCDVTECECGHFTVRIGRTRLDLTREELAQLRQAIADAASRVVRPYEPAGRRERMH